MGINSVPDPGEVMTIIVTAVVADTISMFKYFIKSILCILRILPSPQPESAAEPLQPYSEKLMEIFRNEVPVMRFASVSSNCINASNNKECVVCLNRFEPGSLINKLHCGHVFHTKCMETWLGYSRITCPLCRTQFMSQVPPLAV